MIYMWLSLPAARALLAREPAGEVHDALTRVLSQEDLLPAPPDPDEPTAAAGPALVLVWRQNECVMVLEADAAADKLWEAMKIAGLVSGKQPGDKRRPANPHGEHLAPNGKPIDGYPPQQA